MSSIALFEPEADGDKGDTEEMLLALRLSRMGPNGLLSLKEDCPEGIVGGKAQDVNDSGYSEDCAIKCLGMWMLTLANMS